MPTVHEVSGVVRVGGDMLLVSDADPGVFYRTKFIDDGSGVIPLGTTRARVEALAGGSIAVDLESIEVLADDRVVALSERLRALVSKDGLVAQYDDPFTELGERGLEGLAVRPHADGSSIVAVLWEGGYPEYDELPVQIQQRVGRSSLRPVVLVHAIPAGQVLTKAVGRKQALSVVELAVPQPAGEEPEAQRFRAPDLVWHRPRTGGLGIHCPVKLAKWHR